MSNTKPTLEKPQPINAYNLDTACSYCSERISENFAKCLFNVYMMSTAPDTPCFDREGIDEFLEISPYEGVTKSEWNRFFDIFGDVVYLVML